MKVILVNGSPHEKGCTYTALCEAASTLQEQGIGIDWFWLGRQPIGGCIACRSCATTGRCFMDDQVNEFVALAQAYDGFIFGSPVHYAALAGNFTSFMDRVFFSAGRAGQPDPFRYKPAGMAISARRGGTTAAYDQMNKYFGISEMPIISSTYWNMVHGHTPDDVRQDEEGLQVMRILGRNMAYFLKCIQAGKAAGVPLPDRETSIATNFVR